MGFGTAERKHVRKVFVSQDHQKTDMYGMGSPGPAAGYVIKPSVGKQDSSMSKTYPSWPFSSAARAKDAAGLASPGPAAYLLPESVGPQPDSRKPRSATPGFGASTRDIRAKLCAPHLPCDVASRAACFPIRVHVRDHTVTDACAAMPCAQQTWGQRIRRACTV